MRATPLAILLWCAVCLAAFGVASGVFADAAEEPAQLLAPEEGGPRRWEVSEDDVGFFGASSLEAEVLLTLSEGALLSNLGCAEQADGNWCHVQPFRGGARGYVPAKKLRPALGPDGIVPIGRDNSKRRAHKGDFDGTDEIPCAQEVGQELGMCRADVARSGGGDATVVVTFPTGFARELYFENGEFVKASATMSGVGTDTDWRLADGVHLIRVDDQRYELKTAFILGK